MIAAETLITNHLARLDARTAEAIRRITDAWSLLVSPSEAQQAAVDLVTILTNGERDAPVAIVALDLVEGRARRFAEWAAVPEAWRDLMAARAAMVWADASIARAS